MGIEGNVLPGLRQMKEGGIGYIQLIAEAGAFDQDMARHFFDQSSPDLCYHDNTPCKPPLFNEPVHYCGNQTSVPSG
ncbi:hypothetical protein RE428_27690 [Marinobacter nanhaiticus D15-8W]|nr:hypothetical protein RE428_27690 [Marinobacter nanhaiticus D15-8W]